MSFFGIGRGLYKIVEGVIEGDGEKIFKGIGGTTLSAAGLMVSVVGEEETGEALSQQGEELTEDV